MSTANEAHAVPGVMDVDSCTCQSGDYAESICIPHSSVRMGQPALPRNSQQWLSTRQTASIRNSVFPAVPALCLPAVKVDRRPGSAFGREQSCEFGWVLVVLPMVRAARRRENSPFRESGSDLLSASFLRQLRLHRRALRLVHRCGIASSGAAENTRSRDRSWSRKRIAASSRDSGNTGRADQPYRNGFRRHCFIAQASRTCHSCDRARRAVRCDRL